MIDWSRPVIATMKMIGVECEAKVIFTDWVTPFPNTKTALRVKFPADSAVAFLRLEETDFKGPYVDVFLVCSDDGQDVSGHWIIKNISN